MADPRATHGHPKAMGDSRATRAEATVPLIADVPASRTPPAASGAPRIGPVAVKVGELIMKAGLTNQKPLEDVEDVILNAELKFDELQKLLRVLKDVPEDGSNRLAIYLRYPRARIFLRTMKIPPGYIHQNWEPSLEDSALFYAGFLAGATNNVIEGIKGLLELFGGLILASDPQLARALQKATGGSDYLKQLEGQPMAMLKGFGTMLAHPINAFSSMTSTYKEDYERFQQHLDDLEFYEAGEIAGDYVTAIVTAVEDLPATIKNFGKKLASSVEELRRLAKMDMKDVLIEMRKKGLSKFGLNGSVIEDQGGKAKLTQKDGLSVTLDDKELGMVPDKPSVAASTPDVPASKTHKTEPPARALSPASEKIEKVPSHTPDPELPEAPPKQALPTPEPEVVPSGVLVEPPPKPRFSLKSIFKEDPQKLAAYAKDEWAKVLQDVYAGKSEASFGDGRIRVQKKGNLGVEVREVVTEIMADGTKKEHVLLKVEIPADQVLGLDPKAAAARLAGATSRAGERLRLHFDNLWEKVKAARTEKGRYGEAVTSSVYGSKGHNVWIGFPSHASNAPGLDIVAWDPKNKVLTIIDNKAVAAKFDVAASGAVRVSDSLEDASAMTRNLAQNVAKAKEDIRKAFANIEVEFKNKSPDFVEEARKESQEILAKLDELEKAIDPKSPGRALPPGIEIKITNAAGDSMDITKAQAKFADATGFRPSEMKMEAIIPDESSQALLDGKALAKELEPGKSPNQLDVRAIDPHDIPADASQLSQADLEKMFTPD